MSITILLDWPLAHNICLFAWQLNSVKQWKKQFLTHSAFGGRAVSYLLLSDNHGFCFWFVHLSNYCEHDRNVEGIWLGFKDKLIRYWVVKGWGNYNSHRQMSDLLQLMFWNTSNSGAEGEICDHISCNLSGLCRAHVCDVVILVSPHLLWCCYWISAL